VCHGEFLSDLSDSKPLRLQDNDLVRPLPIRTATQSDPTGNSSTKTITSPRSDQLEFELGDSTQHLAKKFPFRTTRAERLIHTLELATTTVEFGDLVLQVQDTAAEAVDLGAEDHAKAVASGISHELIKPRAIGCSTTATINIFIVDLPATSFCMFPEPS